MTVKVKFVMALAIVGLLTVGIFAKENYNEKKFANQETFTIRLAHVSNETSPIHLQSLKLKELLEAESDGRFKVEIYPNGQLGGDRQATESVSLGTVTASLPGTAILSGFEPKFMVGDLPFLFTSREAAYKAYDNELGEELNKLLDPLNLVNLGYSETGFRHISNSKHPITTPEDLEGIKIRTMENPIHMDSFREWGASPTPMAFSELFTGLQQGTIDAQENPLQIISSSRFYEVQDYLTISGHFFATGSLLFNKDFVDKLPDDLREILYDCARESTIYGRELVAEMEADYLEELKANGMEVNVLTDEQKQLFIDKSKQVYEKYEDVLGKDLIEKARKYNGEQ